jgi:hypothetical protein
MTDSIYVIARLLQSFLSKLQAVVQIPTFIVPDVSTARLAA